MREFRQKLHANLPPTTLWGYNGMFPGPLFDVNQGRAIHVTWENKLPDRHLLPVDKSFHHLDSEPEVRTVTHLHGGVTLSRSDGYPEAWYTQDFKVVGPYFERKVYHYANDQRPLTMWIDPVTEKPKLNDTEIWSFINITNFPHPIHIHLIQFQVLNRQSFGLDI